MISTGQDMPTSQSSSSSQPLANGHGSAKAAGTASPRMGLACVECHRAKAACLGHPCSRCVRLGKECVPRQKHKRRRVTRPAIGTDILTLDAIQRLTTNTVSVDYHQSREPYPAHLPAVLPEADHREAYGYAVPLAHDASSGVYVAPAALHHGPVPDAATFAPQKLMPHLATGASQAQYRHSLHHQWQRDARAPTCSRDPPRAHSALEAVGSASAGVPWTLSDVNATSAQERCAVANASGRLKWPPPPTTLKAPESNSLGSLGSLDLLSAVANVHCSDRLFGIRGRPCSGAPDCQCPRHVIWDLGDGS